MNRTTRTSLALAASLTVGLLMGCGGGHKALTTTPSTSTSTPGNTTPLSPTEYVYVTNALDNTISQFQVAQNGGLIPLAAPTVATGANPSFLTASPTGHFLYVSNAGDGTLSQYQINANGALTPLVPATVPAGTSSGNGAGSVTGPTFLVIEATGHFLYLQNSKDQNLRVYAINNDGTLTFKSVLSGLPDLSCLAAHPTLPTLYAVINANTSLFQFRINSDGTLTALTPATVPAPSNPNFLTLTPNGKFAYLAFDGSPTPAQYQVNTDGTLAVIDLANANLNDSTASALPAVDPGSRFLYTFAQGPTGVQILQSKIQADGRLAPLSPAAIQFGVTESAALTFDPSGKFVYAPSILANAIVGFRIGSDGTLADLPTPAFATGTLPTGADSVQRQVRRRGVGVGHSAMAFIRR